MGKLKIGDTIKIKSFKDIQKTFNDENGSQFFNGIYFNNRMEKFCGNSYVVTFIVDSAGFDENMTVYRVCHNEECWNFPMEWVESFQSKEQLPTPKKPRKFEVGALITGNEDSGNIYSYTNDNSVCEVLEVQDDGYILVKLLHHTNFQKFKGALEWEDGEFEVEEEYFELYED